MRVDPTNVIVDSLLDHEKGNVARGTAREANRAEARSRAEAVVKGLEEHGWIIVDENEANVEFDW